MSNIDKLLCMEKLHKLIKQQYMGSAEEYAVKLNISRATLYNYINDLECFGAKIMYDRTINSFVYLNNFTFELKINIEYLDSEKMKEIKGGCYFRPFF
jgi:predicted DNA-binding transcriptional regulator YafY